MVKVFGSTDRDKAGNIKSEYPSWYFDQIKEDLERDIRETEKSLEMDAIPYTAKHITKEKLVQKKERFEKILDETPKLKDTEKDSFIKIRKDMGGRIGEARYKRSEVERGLIDSHEEARRMSEPIMEIKDDKEADFAKECNIKIIDGKINRNDMERMHKIMSKMLGESTDIEYLRRP